MSLNLFLECWFIFFELEKFSSLFYCISLCAWMHCRAGLTLSAYNYDSAYGKRALMLMYKGILEQVFISFFMAEDVHLNAKISRNSNLPIMENDKISVYRILCQLYHPDVHLTNQKHS